MLCSFNQTFNQYFWVLIVWVYAIFITQNFQYFHEREIFVQNAVHLCCDLTNYDKVIKCFHASKHSFILGKKKKICILISFHNNTSVGSRCGFIIYIVVSFDKYVQFDFQIKESILYFCCSNNGCVSCWA